MTSIWLITMSSVHLRWTQQMFSTSRSNWPGCTDSIYMTSFYSNKESLLSIWYDDITSLDLNGISGRGLRQRHRWVRIAILCPGGDPEAIIATTRLIYCLNSISYQKEFLLFKHVLTQQPKDTKQNLFIAWTPSVFNCPRQRSQTIWIGYP